MVITFVLFFLCQLIMSPLFDNIRSTGAKEVRIQKILSTRGLCNGAVIDRSVLPVRR